MNGVGLVRVIEVEAVVLEVFRTSDHVERPLTSSLESVEGGPKSVELIRQVGSRNV